MCRNGWLCGVLFLYVGVLGCQRSTSAVLPKSVPEVVVSLPVVKEIVDYEDFTGHTEAIKDVEVRARVSGYLDKVLFKEGMEVKQGDPLFAIDPRTYKAELRRAEANVLQAQAKLKRLELSYKRAAGLLPAKAISQDDFETIQGDRDAAVAAVKLAEAQRDLTRLNVDFCLVTASISGRIGRQLIDPGNMVKADETPLTTIVSQDPIYAYFDADEGSVLRARRLIREGKMKSARVSKIPVFLGLGDEKGFPHEGVINFVDNRVDRDTGTLRLRGIFPNPKRILSEGLFVRIRVPMGTPHSALLIPEQALGSDQGQKFVYVVNDQNEVVYRQVKVGASQDGMSVIEEGLKPGERVVVAGLQRIRPGIKVQPKMMPQTLGPAASGQPSATQPESPVGQKPSSSKGSP